MTNLMTVVRSLLHPQTLAWFIPAAVCYLAVVFTEAHDRIEQQILMVKRETAQRLAKENDQMSPDAANRLLGAIRRDHWALSHEDIYALHAALLEADASDATGADTDS